MPDSSNFPIDYSQWPSVLAFSLKEYYRQSQAVLKLWNACDTVELTLRLLVAIGLADLRKQDGELPRKLIGEFKSRVETPTLGKWEGMAQAVARRITARGKLSIAPEIAPAVNEVITPLLDGPDNGPAHVETSFKMLRNQLAHGGGVTQSMADGLLNVWAPRFEASMAELDWLTEPALLVRDNGGYGRLLGAAPRPVEYAFEHESARQAAEALWAEGVEVVLARGDRAAPLWPLVGYGRPRGPQQAAAEVEVSQVYLRRGPARLEMTPIGSDEVCQSVASDDAFQAFIQLFRLKEKDKQPDRRVRGFEEEMAQEAQQLVGRRRELAHLAQALVQAAIDPAAAPEDRVLWITGEAGIGKSFLLSYTAWRLTEDGNGAKTLLDDGGDRDPRLPHKTLAAPYRFKAGDPRCNLETFLTFCLERLGDDGQPDDDGPAADPTERQARLIARLSTRLAEKARADQPVVFILDGLEEIAEAAPGFFTHVPFGLDHPHVAWLCAGRPTAGLPDAFSPDRCRRLFPEGLRMSDQDIRAMLLEGMGPVVRDRLLGKDREAGAKVLNPFVERVAERADGLPIYVHYVLEDIRNNRITDFDEHSVLPQSLNDYHHRLIGSLSLGGAGFVAPFIAAFLALAREPIEASALTEILTRAHLLPADEESVAWVSQGLSSLGSIITLAETPEREDGFTFFHRSFKQHMFESDETRPPVKLAAEGFRRLAVDPGGPDSPAAPYLCRWGATHLLEGGRREDALALLTDFHYLMNRLRVLPTAEGVAGVSADWAKLTAEGPLEGRAAIWEEFWRTREHLLLRGTSDWPPERILLQTAWEHARQSPVTEAAEAWLAEGHCDWDWLRLAPNLRPEQIQKSSLKRVLKGHDSEVTALALSPDGRLAVSGGFSGVIRLWNAITGELVKTFSGHDGLINALALALDGTAAVSASFDGTARVWDLERQTPGRVLTGHEKPILDLAVSPSGRIAATASQDRTIRVWDLTDGACLKVLSGHRRLIRSVAFVDEDRLVSASLDRRARLWDLTAGETIRVFKGHADGLTRAAVLKNPDRLITACRDGSIRVWPLDGGEPILLEGHEEAVDLLAATPDGRTAVSAGWDATVRVWDTDTGRQRLVIDDHQAKLEALALTPDGALIVSGGADGSLQVHDIATGLRLQRLEANTGGVLCLDVIAGDLAAAGGSDQAVGLWEISRQAVASEEVGHQGQVLSIRPAPDEPLLVSHGRDASLRLWNMHDGRCLGVLEGAVWHTSAIAQDADGPTILATEANGDLTVWSAARAQRRLTLAEGLGAVTQAAMSPDGRFAAVAAGRRIGVWDLSGEPQVTWIERENAAAGVLQPAWARQALLIGFDDGALLWRPLADEQPATTGRTGSGVKALALALNRDAAAAVCEDSHLHIWDLESPDAPAVITGMPHGADVLAFTEDGRKVVSFGPDMIVRVWDPETGACESATGLAETPRRHPEAYTRVFPNRGRPEACVWNDHSLGMALFRPGRPPAVWCAGNVWHPLIHGRPAVFERVGSVSALRVLDLVAGGRVMDKM